MERGRWALGARAARQFEPAADGAAPYGAPRRRERDPADYDYADGVTFHVFALEDGTVAAARVPAPNGSIEAAIEARRVGARIEVSVQGASSPWSVLLRGIESVASVVGGTAKVDELGVRVVPDAGTRSVVVRLAESIRV